MTNEFEEGDSVIVTNKDGETTDGTVVGYEDEPVGSYTQDWMDGGCSCNAQTSCTSEDECPNWEIGETLLDYWSGNDDVRSFMPVVTVDLGGGEYSYPISRVEVDDDE